ncbi:hypothetical protein [Geobacillus stearothermophilus]|uniref:hypothetical protein n=1 Tax=Geobacillus stearothermophilus TaxID=1422 RepID=UPI00399D23BF
MKSAEDATIKKADFERKRDEYMERIRRAVNRLKQDGTGIDHQAIYDVGKALRLRGI